MLLKVSLPAINRVLGGTFLGLTVPGLLSEIFLNVYGEDWGFGLIPLVNLTYESNIPTWYSSILLFACSLLLALVAWIKFAQRAAYRWHWAVLAMIFLYISIDESAQIHEMLNPALTDNYHLGGIFYFSWVIPFGIFVVLFAIAYIGFLRHLPRRFRLWFVLAGGIYVGGALGTELPISWWYDNHGGDNLVYGLFNLVQESLEILGVTVFIAALLAFIQAEVGELRLAVR